MSVGRTTLMGQTFFPPEKERDFNYFLIVEVFRSIWKSIRKYAAVFAVVWALFGAYLVYDKGWLAAFEGAVRIPLALIGLVSLVLLLGLSVFKFYYGNKILAKHPESQQTETKQAAYLGLFVLNFIVVAYLLNSSLYSSISYLDDLLLRQDFVTLYSEPVFYGITLFWCLPLMLSVYLVSSCVRSADEFQRDN